MATEVAIDRQDVYIPAEAADGVYIVGEFMGYRDRELRRVPSRVAGQPDREFVNCDIGIRLDGGPLEVVQFPDRKSAEAYGASWAVGQRVAVRALNKFGVGKLDGRPWQFYTAPGQGTERSAFAEEFSA